MARALALLIHAVTLMHACSPIDISARIHDKVVLLSKAELLAASLRAANVPVELLIAPSGGHGFTLGRDQASAVWKERFLTWLDALP